MVVWLKAESVPTMRAATSRVVCSFIGVYSIRRVSTVICLLHSKSVSSQTQCRPKQIKLSDLANSLLKRRWLLIADSTDTDEAARALRARFRPNVGGHVLVTSLLGRWPINIAHLALEVFLPDDAARYLQDRVAKEGQHAGE
jgi:hypothetical protein